MVDSSVWIANLRNQRTPPVDLLLTLAGREPLIVGDLVMLEVLQGARDEVHAARIEHDLRRYVLQPMLTEDIAVQAARNYRAMRTSGITVRKTVVMIIGTFCIQRGHQLLHDDRDFDPMERLLGLSVIR
ncbi:MAG TPA: PIN domain nuclease [Rhodopila sp.]|nr:PIN domain nuclease [Rhodopila sp.]